MTPRQAELIMLAHDIDQVLASYEETELLQQSNPELLAAYIALEDLADRDDEPWDFEEIVTV